MNWAILWLVIIVAAFVIIYKYLQNARLEKLLMQDLTEQPNRSRWSFLFPANEDKIKRIREKHHHKVSREQLQQTMEMFSKEPSKITPSNFHRLKAMVHTYERHHKNEPQHKANFENLDHLLKKLDEWQNNKPLSPQDKKDIINELKMMIESK